jgi:nitrous oxide reductase
MKKFFNIIIITLLQAYLSSTTYAAPAPFGITIGSNIEEVKQKYSLNSAGINAYSKGRMYSLNPAQVDFEGLESARIICSKDGKVLVVSSKIAKNKYDKIYNMLSEKYQLVSEKGAFVGDRWAKFTDDNTEILLTAPHLSFELILEYTDNEFNEIYNTITNEENQRQEKQEKGQL